MDSQKAYFKRNGLKWWQLLNVCILLKWWWYLQFETPMDSDPIFKTWCSGTPASPAWPWTVQTLDRRISRLKTGSDEIWISLVFLGFSSDFCEFIIRELHGAARDSLSRWKWNEINELVQIFIWNVWYDCRFCHVLACPCHVWNMGLLDCFGLPW